MKLSIIVPVYQVEQYIRPCVESIFVQGMADDEFEVILVDDGTRDESFARIADLIARHGNIVVVKQTNQGLSAARNTGLDRAAGEYVLFLDSDDLLLPQRLGLLVERAVEGDADLLVAGFVKASDEEVGNVKASEETNEVEEKTGREYFISNLNPRECFVWRTLYKTSFLIDNNLRFIPGIYFEDVPFTTACCLKAGRCLVTGTLFYIYRQRPQSICSSVDARKIYDLNTVVAHLWNMRKTQNLSPREDEKFMEVIFTTFSIAQWYILNDDDLFTLRRELVEDLKQKAPGLRFSGSFKQTAVSFFLREMPNLYLWFRRLCVRKK